MLSVSDKAELRHEVKKLKNQGKKISFVPTMGNLHAGHISLIKKAQDLADIVVVSIFVNPLQFGENEDFADYPRTLIADKAKLEDTKVDILFTPRESEIYPQNLQASTKVLVPEVSDILCGEYRPGFFVGVATVVAKLFNIVLPDIAVFGEKDFQQLHIVQRMVQELDFPLEIVSSPTIREADGLAMSSRNSYLSTKERLAAPLLHQSLMKAREQFIAGKDVLSIEKIYNKFLAINGFKPDYFVIKDAISLGQPAKGKDAVILAAAWLGTTRLIDNVIIRH